MNIFGVGGAELILILLIMLIVAGPKRMIRWSYVLGQYVSKARNMWAQVAEVIQKEFQDAGMDVDIPKDLPTRQNIGKVVQQIAKPIIDPIANPLNEALKETKKATELPSLGAWSKPTVPTAPASDETVTLTETPAFGTWSTLQNGNTPPEKAES